MSKRLQRLCVILIAAIWWPLSAFSHAHMTAMIAQSTGDSNHPALETAHHTDARTHGALTHTIIVIDAALFWDQVEQYEGDCKQGALCASIAAVVPTSGAVMSSFEASESTPRARDLFYPSRQVAPDTPPPRVFL